MIINCTIIKFSDDTLNVLSKYGISIINKAKQKNIAFIAGKIVTEKGYVSAIDLFLKIGWLTPDNLANWSSGQVPYLEKVIIASLGKITRTMKEFKSWAIHSKLKPSFTVYKHKNIKLRFSKSGMSNIETAYGTHYVL